MRAQVTFFEINMIPFASPVSLALDINMTVDPYTLPSVYADELLFAKNSSNNLSYNLPGVILCKHLLLLS